MTKIKEAFENKKAFIAYLTAGDPDLETTEKLIYEMAKNGVDLIEIGIPFSDPVAEGPVIQEADIRALQSGTTTEKIFDMIERIRPNVRIPLVFLTYCNSIFGYGTKKFTARCEEIGIDGLIVPDVPYEEREELAPFCDKHGIDLIALVAPTSEDRVYKIAKASQGFLYIVSSLGVTGMREKIDTDVDKIIKASKSVSDIPCAIGFGISTPEQAKQFCQYSDGIIIGSAIVRIIGEYGKDSIEPVGEFVRSVAQAVHG